MLEYASGSWDSLTQTAGKQLEGVQSNSNHDRDTDHIEEVGFMPFIIISIIMTLLFVALIFGILQWVLADS